MRVFLSPLSPRLLPPSLCTFRSLSSPSQDTAPFIVYAAGAVHGLSADANRQIFIGAAIACPTRQALLLRRRREHRQVVALGPELVVRSSPSTPYTAEMSVEQGPKRTRNLWDLGFHYMSWARGAEGKLLVALSPQLTLLLDELLYPCRRWSAQRLKDSTSHCASIPPSTFLFSLIPFPLHPLRSLTS